MELKVEILIKPATSHVINNLDNMELTSSTVYRTPPFNFNCKVVVETIDLQKLAAHNNINMQNLVLSNLSRPPNKTYRQKCSVSFASFNLADIDSTSSKPLHKNIKSTRMQCGVCKHFFKGKRGLNLHLGRNSDCKRNIKQSCSNTFVDENELSVPQQILNVVKCPSTSVESLENLCGDGKNTKIKDHNSKHGCKLCPLLSTKDHFVSSSTHRVYESVIPDNITSVNCNCTNVIYLITCRKCRLQYVGETAQLLRDRIRHHNSCINHPEQDNTCRILSEHFSKGHCKNATFTVHIIEKLNGNGRDDLQVIDSAITAIRRKKETDWMLKLRTVFPYGLNDRVGDEYMSDKDCININSKFPSLKRTKVNHRVRSKTYTSSDFICKNFIYIINESLRTNLRNTMNLVRVLLSSLRKSSCKQLFTIITDYLSEKHDTFLFSQYFDAALDILASRLGTLPIQQSPRKTSPSNRCHVTFNNKAIDFINVQKILSDKDVVNCLPHDLRNDTPVVVYELSETIHSKIFNYKKFVQSMDVDAFLSDETILPCECHTSSFCDQDHKHVITGNLDLVTDLKLRNLISKGPKYREPVQFSCEKATEEVLKGIDKCINAWSNKVGLSVAVFRDWKEMIASKIKDRVSALANNKKRHIQSIFKDANAKKCLSDLQARYVIVPIDKAANNVAFICKRYYASVILQELGLSGSSTSTYTNIDDQSAEDIINHHKAVLKDQFKMTVDSNMLSLPDIYWTPKLHKSPVKFRFIIASKCCTVKQLSKNISSIFSLFSKQIEAYNKKVHYYTGIKPYWIVQNRDPVLEAVKKSAPRKSAKCVSSFDFSTLYTKIPHDKLIDVLNKVIEFAFKGGTRKRIAIDRHGTAYWVKYSNNKSSLYTFTKESIINAVSFLIRNCYFKFGDKLFRQDIGIPMGSDPAPFFANLFLYHYESSWLKSIRKTNNTLARKFGKVFRYIDDLLALNDGLSFESFYSEIYPEELQLNKENEDNTQTNFLDLHIAIDNGIFVTQLYDKRDSFGFQITRLPYKNSNIPCRMFYTSIAAECLRICRATSWDIEAIKSIKSLLFRMGNQGAEKSKMKNFIAKTFNRHQISQKYGITENRLINQLFN